MISTPYDQRRETAGFVCETSGFVFAVFGRLKAQSETDGLRPAAPISGAIARTPDGAEPRGTSSRGPRAARRPEGWSSSWLRRRLLGPPSRPLPGASRRGGGWAVTKLRNSQAALATLPPPPFGYAAQGRIAGAWALSSPAQRGGGGALRKRSRWAVTKLRESALKLMKSLSSRKLVRGPGGVPTRPPERGRRAGLNSRSARARRSPA